MSSSRLKLPAVVYRSAPLDVAAAHTLLQPLLSTDRPTLSSDRVVALVDSYMEYAYGAIDRADASELVPRMTSDAATDALENGIVRSACCALMQHGQQARALELLQMAVGHCLQPDTSAPSQQRPPASASPWHATV